MLCPQQPPPSPAPGPPVPHTTPYPQPQPAHSHSLRCQDIFNLLPNLNVAELSKSFAVESNDMMLVMCVAAGWLAVAAGGGPGSSGGVAVAHCAVHEAACLEGCLGQPGTNWWHVNLKAQHAQPTSQPCAAMTQANPSCTAGSPSEPPCCTTLPVQVPGRPHPLRAGAAQPDRQQGGALLPRAGEGGMGFRGWDQRFTFH